MDVGGYLFCSEQCVSRVHNFLLIVRTFYSILILLLLVALPINNVDAQTMCWVRGRVQDAKMGLIGGNVVLKDKQTLFGTTTDTNGSYHIQVPKGKYNLEITYVGYVKYTANVEVDGNLTLPTITLYEDSQLMDEVVVTARTITYNANGYITEISKNPLFREQDMTNILKLTPGTNTTTDKIQVYGEDVSKVYLNGRELKLTGEQLMNYLSTLVGKNIKQMEVVAASGVDEDANTMGSSIIKITAINPEIGGMLNVGGLAIYGSKGRYAYLPNFNLNWRLGKKWATYLNGRASFNEVPSKQIMETFFYDTNERIYDELNGKSRQRGSYKTLWGISYDLTSNDLFSLEASYSNGNYVGESHEVVQRGIGSNHNGMLAEGNISNENKDWDINLSFIYTHKFSSASEFSFQADRLERNTTTKNDYFYSADDKKVNHTLSDEKHLFYTARIDYTQNFSWGNGTLKAGVKYANILDEQDTDYTYYRDGQKDNETSYLDLYKYSEEVYAAYAQYSFKIQKFDFTTGLRVEHALLSPHSLVEQERNQDNKHTDWAPELGINYAWNKEKGHNISLQYNRSIERPFFAFLNPRIIRNKEYAYWSGNPLLGSTVTDRYSLRASFFNGYTLSLSKSYTDDGIIQLPTQINGLIYTTPQTGMKYTKYSVYIGAPVKLKQWGRLNFSVGYNYSEQSYQEDKGNNERWNFNISGLFQFPKEVTCNVDLSHSTPDKSLYGETRSNVMGTLRVSKSFLNRSLNVAVMFNDLFNSAGSLKREYYYGSHSEIMKMNYNSFNCSVNVRYTFRWGQKSMVRRGGSGNAEEINRFNSN